MRRVLSTVIAVALLLALGALAAMALPNGSAPMTASSFAAAPLAAEPDAPAAPAATNKFNVIALPLDSSAQLTYTADGLLAFIGPSAQQVLAWDAPSQSYLFRFPDGFGDNFPLRTGGVYWLELDSTAPQIASFVGDVPAAGTIKFDLVGASPCMWNEISVPLDRSDITTASQLINAIGDVDQVVTWDATTNSYIFQYADGFGDNFPVRIGYPYGVCALSSKTWPQ